MVSTASTGGWYGGGYRGPTIINTGDINIGNNVNIGNRADAAEGRANLLSIMTPALHTDIKDPIERLRATRDDTLGAKATTAALGKATLTRIPMNLPAPVARNLYPLLVTLSVQSRTLLFNTLISNVAIDGGLVVLVGFGPGDTEQHRNDHARNGKCPGDPFRLQQDNGHEGIENHIGKEMRKHGAFQAIAPEQPAKRQPGNTVQDKGAAEHQRIHRPADSAGRGQVRRAEYQRESEIGNPEQRRPESILWSRRQ